MERLVDWKALKTMVPYSRVHIGRLEEQGLFPKRVRLGPHRCAWVLSEVDAWIRERMDNR
jgi:prophage regulatory protein